jgi:hypothetical protein
VERGLSLFKDGEDAVKTEKIRLQKARQANIESGDLTQKGKNRQAPAPRSMHLFTENPWGVRACRSVQATAKIDARRWEIILESAIEHVDGKDVGFDVVHEESSDTLDEDDHAMVDLNW